MHTREWLLILRKSVRKCPRITRKYLGNRFPAKFYDNFLTFRGSFRVIDGNYFRISFLVTSKIPFSLWHSNGHAKTYFILFQSLEKTRCSNFELLRNAFKLKFSFCHIKRNKNQADKVVCSLSYNWTVLTVTIRAGFLQPAVLFDLYRLIYRLD